MPNKIPKSSVNRHQDKPKAETWNKPIAPEQIVQLPTEQRLIWDKFMDILIRRATELNQEKDKPHNS